MATLNTMLPFWFYYLLAGLVFGSLLVVVIMVLCDVWKHRPKASLKFKLPCLSKPRAHSYALPPFWDWRTLISITAFVLGTRLVLNLLGMFSLWLDDQTLDWQSFRTLWNHWDTGQYLYLAQHGYRLVGDYRFVIVFFPLYPLLMKLVQFGVADYLLAGLIVSNVSLVVASYYFYRLTYLDHGPKMAYQTMKFLLLNPLAIFFSAVYTESLFLALTLACFYYIRLHRWVWVGVFGLLATLTRSVGVLLLLPAVWELGGSLWPEPGTKFWRPHHLARAFISQGVFLLLIPYGLFLYLLLNKVLTGSWLRFMTYQAQHWHHTPIFFAQNIWNIAHSTFGGSQFSLIVWGLQIVYLVLIVGFLVWFWKKIHPTYLLFSLAYIIFVYSSNWLISGGRYLMILFPFYIAIALATRKRVVNDLVTFTFVLLLGFYSVVFFKGYSLL